MKIISIFNNKGGVGKTTLAFHLSCALAEMNYRVLMIDLDPQCNLTLCAIDEKQLEEIWKSEDDFIDSFDATKNLMSPANLEKINSKPRTIHYLLKPTEEGTGEFEELPPTLKVKNIPNLDLIPGRLTLHKYENKISERWSGAYQGDPLSIRTITRIRKLSSIYALKYTYDYIIIDTSPSLGVLNKVIISTSDGFLIPCLPDMFSRYGIRNIGTSLNQWQKELTTIYELISDQKRDHFPNQLVQFLGYTIYNAKKYDNSSNDWNLATAHYNYAKQIPSTIEEYIPEHIRQHLTKDMVKNPIGGTAVMHTHNTLPGMSQKYKSPIWKIPSLSNLDKTDRPTISGNRNSYEITKEKYKQFAEGLIERIQMLD
jgi:cellulose biosynthesis protein BcsQ